MIVWTLVPLSSPVHTLLHTTKIHTVFPSAPLGEWLLCPLSFMPVRGAVMQTAIWTHTNTQTLTNLCCILNPSTKVSSTNWGVQRTPRAFFFHHAKGCRKLCYFSPTWVRAGSTLTQSYTSWQWRRGFSAAAQGKVYRCSRTRNVIILKEGSFLIYRLWFSLSSNRGAPQIFFVLISLSSRPLLCAYTHNHWQESAWLACWHHPVVRAGSSFSSWYL